VYCGNCGTQLNEPATTTAATHLIDMPALPVPFVPDSVASSPLVDVSIGNASDSEALLSTSIGERRIATVVVTDLTGSTVLLEKVGTETWVMLMNRVLHLLETEIERFGGMVEQFRGDGLVAFFGATVAHEDDPERAVLAALAMQDALSAFVPDVAKRYNTQLQLRVGINTGEVIVTAPGERRPHSEIAMGIAISVADRMEGAATPGTVLVSEDTYHLVETKFEWQALGEISVQGIARPIPIYRPISPKSTTEQDRNLEARALQSDVPMIGRDVEFDILRRCVDDMLSGRGRIVLLTGEKGLGKSLLINQVRDYYVHRESLLAAANADGTNEAMSNPSAIGTGDAKAVMGAGSDTALRGRCRSYTQGWPFSMWVDALQNWLGADESNSKEAMRDRLRRQAQLLWQDTFVEHYSALATLLSLPLESEYQERVRRLNSEDLRQSYFLTLHSWLRAISRRGSLLMTFADMQWADSTSLEALQYCLSLSDTESIMFLLVGRAERGSTMPTFEQYLTSEYPHRLTRITLAPLDNADSMQLIEAVLGPNALPPHARDLILRNAEGNPYFLQEMIRTLVANGVLVHEDGQAGTRGRWRMTRAISSVDLPGSLLQLLQSRIDRLSVEERSVLQVASVIGSVFWANVVQALAGRGRMGQLIALQRAQLIRETGKVPELGMQYLFASPLLREAAYDSLLTAQRIGFHARVAEYLERHVSAGALAGYHGLLAYHYRGAQNPRKELLYTLLAADEARKVYANAEALFRYTRALTLLDQLEQEPLTTTTASAVQRAAVFAQRFEVLKGRCTVRFALGESEGAAEDADALLHLAREMGDDPTWLMDALLMQIEVHSDSDGREQVTKNLNQAYQVLVLAQQRGDLPREMQTWMAIAQARLKLRLPESGQAAERALELARQLQDRQAEVALLINISNAYGADNLPRSEAYLQEALARAEQLDDKGTRISLLGAIGQQFERRGDYYHLLVQYAQPVLQLTRETGNRRAEAKAANYCGQIVGSYLGDYLPSLPLIEESLRKWEPATGRVIPLLRMAQIHTSLGNLVDAQSALDQARPYTENTLMSISRVGFDLVSAILDIAKGDEASLRAAQAATWDAQQMVANNLVSRQYRMAASCIAAAAHLRLAELLGTTSDNPERLAEREQHIRWALESSQWALDTYIEFGFTQVVECTGEEILYRHSQALAANVRDDEAIVYLERAHAEMMRKHDMIPADSNFRRTFLNIALHREILDALAVQHASTK
jgi:predicted ATPase/class 3 adenylate cyclase